VEISPAHYTEIENALIWKDRSSIPRNSGLGEMWARAFVARVQGREAAGISTGLSFFGSGHLIG